METTIQAEHAGDIAAKRAPKGHGRRRGCKAFTRAMLSGTAPDAEQARAMLRRLEAQTGLSRSLRAYLLGVPAHSLRRWEDGTRLPDQAARRLIALTCMAVAGMNAFEIIYLMMQEANGVGADNSRPAGEQVAALRMVARLGTAQAELSRQILTLAGASETGKAGRN